MNMRSYSFIYIKYKAIRRYIGMKSELMKEKLSAIKDKTVEIAKRVGAKNMIIVCAVLVCAVAIALNFIIAGTSGGGKGADGYKIDPSYYSALLEGEETEVGADAENENDSEKTSVDDYFDSAVLNRDRARDEAIEVLSTVASSDSALEEVRVQAEADIAAIAEAIEIESNIEELIKAKGIEECVAVINGELASIIVRSDGLLPSEVAQITEIVYEQAGITPTNLNIIEK